MIRVYQAQCVLIETPQQTTFLQPAAAAVLNKLLTVHGTAGYPALPKNMSQTAHKKEREINAKFKLWRPCFDEHDDSCTV
jgi:hypothetical protein